MEIGDLIGTLRNQSDLEVRLTRIIYQENGGRCDASRVLRMVYPKVDGEMLDLRTASTLRFCVDYQNVGDGPTNTTDSPDVRSLFSRLVVKCGSQVLCDIDDLGSLLLLESRIHTSANTSGYEKSLRGDTGRDAQDRSERLSTGTEYIVQFAPNGSLLNSNSVLPISQIGNLTFELHLDDPQNCLSSDNPQFTYSLSKIECLAQYIRSPSLSSYFQSNPLQFHVRDYTMRYSTINERNALVRMSSSHTSVDSIITLLRSADRLNGGRAIADKKGERINGLESTNLYVNSKQFYDIDVDSVAQRWQHFKSVYPHVKHSSEFTDFDSTSHVITTKLSASPVEFSDRLISGVKSSSLNTDIVQKLTFVDQPVSPIIATSFISSSVLIYLDSNTKDLKIRY